MDLGAQITVGLFERLARLVRFTRHGTDAAVLCVQCGVGWMMIEAPKPPVLATGSALLLASAIWRTSFWLRRRRLLADRPGITIAAAPQGRVELRGAAALGEASFTQSLSGARCCWYRLQTWRDNADGGWTLESDEASDHTFLIRDASGECIVDPQHAEVLVEREIVQVLGERKTVETMILPGERIVIAGEFRTLRPASDPGGRRDRIAWLLDSWKADPRSLLSRFDADSDGKITPEEWQAARAAAATEIDAEIAVQTMQPPINVVRAGDTPLLVSTLAEPGALRLMALKAAWHACVGAGGAFYLLWWLARRLH